MKTSKFKSGSAHLIIIIILVVALLGALGFVFWQNFINKPATTDTKTNTTQQSSTTASDTELTESVSATYGGREMTLKYPKSWLVVDDGTAGSGITSPDGNVIVRYTLTPPDGIGGTCGDVSDSVYDPIAEATWAAIPGTTQAIFSSYITHYLVSDSTPKAFYSYGFSAVKNSDVIKNVKAGDSSCPVYIFANYVNLDDQSGATMHVETVFKNLYQDGLYQIRADLTLDEIKTTFATAYAQVAEKIIESITLN